MFEVIAFAAVLIAVGQLWSRMAGVEQRLRQIELGAAVSGTSNDETPPVEPAKMPRELWRAPARVRERRREVETMREPVFEPARLEWLGAEPLKTLPQEPEPANPEPRGSAFGFEELFGRRLPIWAGGITLAVAGVLIVRYSIEAGLLSPLVRFVGGLMFGAGLIAAAETALRFEDRVRDVRVRQALAGAGIASLYASILVAVNVYALIGPAAAFLGMAAVTALAMALSLRFGAPSALLGLLGGLAAPALVGAGEPNVPLLTLYLGLAVGGLSALSRAQNWAWLGVSALVGGLGWGAILLLSGVLDAASALSIGFYLLLVGIAFPLLALPGGGTALIRIAGTVAAAAQMAALVATGGFAPLHWGLFGLISIAIVWLSTREEPFRHLPVIGAGIALLLLGAWPQPEPGLFVLVSLAAAAIYGGSALLVLWRAAGGMLAAGRLAGIALGLPLLAAMHFYRADGSADMALAAAALAAACMPAAAALLGWSNPERHSDARFALLSSAAALLVAIAAAFAAPIWLLPLLVGGVALALLLLSLRAEDERLEWSGWAFAAATLPLLGLGMSFEQEFDRARGLPEQVQAGLAALRWAGLAAIAAFFAWRARLAPARAAAQVAATLLAYGAVAQVAPPSVLPLLPPLALLALATAARSLSPRVLLPAMGASLSLIASWAVFPLLHWAGAAVPAIGGDPVLLGGLPAVRDVLLRLLVPAALIVAALRMDAGRAGADARKVALAVAAWLGAVALHILYKQLFAITSADMFIRLGLAERTLWEALLVFAGAAAWKLGHRLAATGLCLAGLAHFALFTLLLHNPLGADQAVGGVPVLNLLLPSYGLALALLWAARRVEPELFARFERPRGLLQMLLILLLAFSSLRQAAEGTILSGPGLSAGEDIARSILAVLLAIGFLLWGLRKGARDWRIASLVLMVGAAGKVFLLDASGLEGLLRIASFVALGFSLIGIGWLYSRAPASAPPLSSPR